MINENKTHLVAWLACSCLLVEYAWVVPLQRNPAARRSREFLQQSGGGGRRMDWLGRDHLLFLDLPVPP